MAENGQLKKVYTTIWLYEKVKQEKLSEPVNRNMFYTDLSCNIKPAFLLGSPPSCCGSQFRPDGHKATH